LPSWEDTWVTQRWELRVLSFIMAICEVNAYLDIRFYEGKKRMPSLFNSRRKYGWQLILNDDLVEETVEHYQMVLEGSHTLCQALPHARIYRNRHWICDALQKYQQYACAILDVTTISELIVHVIPVSGCMALAMFVMF
jgi:hypothetical protein